PRDQRPRRANLSRRRAGRRTAGTERPDADVAPCAARPQALRLAVGAARRRRSAVGGRFRLLGYPGFFDRHAELKNAPSLRTFAKIRPGCSFQTIRAPLGEISRRSPKLPVMTAGKFFAAALFGLFVGACDPRLISEGQVTREDGSILYMPKGQPSIHADGAGRSFVFPHRIIDDETGYSLNQVVTLRVAGFDGFFTQWRLDRSKAGQPDVYFLTRNRRERPPGAPPWAPVME